LIKVQAQLPGSESFRSVFVKQASDVITLFYNCISQGTANPKMQEEAQRLIDSNALKDTL
jgi:hypothetical protein